MKRIISSKWISDDYWDDDYWDDDVFEEIWVEYLAEPEKTVNEKYHIFCEPSVQGGQGAMVVFDESGNDNEAIFYDYESWCTREYKMASESKNAAEYQQKYNDFISSLLSEEGWK